MCPTQVNAEIARANGLAHRVVELGNMSFCDQVATVYAAKLLVGVFGAAVGGNVVLTHDEATTVELTACGHSNPHSVPRPNLGHTFQPLAAQIAKGFLIFCICVDDDDVDLAVKRTDRRGGWFRSNRLLVDASNYAKALTALVHHDFRAASLVASDAPCRTTPP